MARTNKKGELFSHLTSFARYADKTASPLSTTLSAAEAAGQTVLSLVSATNAVVDDYIRVGVDEDMEITQIASIASLDITNKWAIGKAHPLGDPVVEQTRTELGHITDEGVRWSIEASDEIVRSAIRALELGYLSGHYGMMFEVGLEGFNVENLATALGIPETSITGSGTASAPSQLYMDGSNFRVQGTNTTLAFEASGVRKDGKIVRAIFEGVEMDVAALAPQFARGTPSIINLRGRCTSGVRLLENTA